MTPGEADFWCLLRRVKAAHNVLLNHLEECNDTNFTCVACWTLEVLEMTVESVERQAWVDTP